LYKNQDKLTAFAQALHCQLLETGRTVERICIFEWT